MSTRSIPAPWQEYMRSFVRLRVNESQGIKISRSFLRSTLSLLSLPAPEPPFWKADRLVAMVKVRLASADDIEALEAVVYETLGKGEVAQRIAKALRRNVEAAGEYASRADHLPFKDETKEDAAMEAEEQELASKAQHLARRLAVERSSRAHDAEERAKEELLSARPEETEDLVEHAMRSAEGPVQPEWGRGEVEGDVSRAKGALERVEGIQGKLKEDEDRLSRLTAEGEREDKAPTEVDEAIRGDVSTSQHAERRFSRLL